MLHVRMLSGEELTSMPLEEVTYCWLVGNEGMIYPT